MRRILNNIKNHSNWLAYYKHKYLDNQKNGFTFRCRGGIKIKVPRRLLHTYKECFFDETYLKGIPTSLTKFPIKTVVDIGANVGYFSLFMLSINPRAKVFAYEPIPKNFELLSRYKSENPSLDFQIFNEAVSKSSQKSITLHFDETDAFTTSASIFKDHETKNQFTVESTCLERIIQDNRLTGIDFIKIDCEGSEYDIIYDAPPAILDKISIISIETHPGKNENENTAALSNYLEKK